MKRLALALGTAMVSVATALPSTTAAAQGATPAPLPMALTLADMHAGLVMDRVEKLPTYAGVAVSPDNSTIEVFVTRPESSLHTAAVSAAGGAPVKLVTVKHSYAALQAMTQRVLRDWDAIEATGIDIVSLGVKDSRNVVEVGIAGHTNEKAARILKRYASPMVSVIAEAEVSLHNSREWDSTPWNGGTFVDGNCTTGPAVKNSSGQKFLLSAGHCFVDNGETVSTYSINAYQHSPRFSSGPLLGYARAQLPAVGVVGYDLALISVSSTGGAYGYNYRTDPPAQTGTVGSPQKRTIRMAEGVRGCMSGAFSGERCAAEVDTFDKYFEPSGGARIHHSNRMRRDNTTQPLAGPGDSGGPVYQVQADGLAVGGYILGGGSGLECTNNDYWNRGFSCTAYEWFAGINSILATTGMSLYTV